jgi:hypothetical protein
VSGHSYICRTCILLSLAKYFHDIRGQIAHYCFIVLIGSTAQLNGEFKISPEIEIILQIEKNYKENCPDTHYQLKQLAKQNNRIACRLVGLNHLSGNGASKNGDIAMRWLERAAKLGDMESINHLHSYYSKNSDTYQMALWQKVCSTLYPEKDNSPANDDYLSETEKQRIEDEAGFILEQIQQNREIPETTSGGTPQVNPIKTMVLSDGSKYEGHLSKLLPEGVGRKTSKTGDYYIGEFSNGLEHGYGSWYNKQGILQYQGLWHLGKAAVGKD